MDNETIGLSGIGLTLVGMILTTYYNLPIFMLLCAVGLLMIFYFALSNLLIELD